MSQLEVTAERRVLSCCMRPREGLPSSTMRSPFPRAALWVIGTTCLFEPFVALGVLAVFGFEHAAWALRLILPLAGLKLLGSIVGLRLCLGPARVFAALSPAEQARRPEAAAAALEAVLRTPVRFPIIQGALW